MGRMKDYLAIIHGGGDEAVEIAQQLMGLSDFTVQDEPGWVCVEERLPESECRCLVAIDGEVRSATYYPPGKFQPEITHWMPLPEPPA